MPITSSKWDCFGNYESGLVCDEICYKKEECMEENLMPRKKGTGTSTSKKVTKTPKPKKAPVAETIDALLDEIDDDEEKEEIEDEDSLEEELEDEEEEEEEEDNDDEDNDDDEEEEEEEEEDNDDEEEEEDNDDEEDEDEDDEEELEEAEEADEEENVKGWDEFSTYYLKPFKPYKKLLPIAEILASAFVPITVKVTERARYLNIKTELQILYLYFPTQRLKDAIRVAVREDDIFRDNLTVEKELPPNIVIPLKNVDNAKTFINCFFGEEEVEGSSTTLDLAEVIQAASSLIDEDEITLKMSANEIRDVLEDAGIDNKLVAQLDDKQLKEVIIESSNIVSLERDEREEKKKATSKPKPKKIAKEKVTEMIAKPTAKPKGRPKGKVKTATRKTSSKVSKRKK